MTHTIAIVRARFNEEFTEEMREAAEARAAELGLTVADVIEVPGAHEVPWAANRLLARDELDGVVALGAVITGGTDHDEVIAHNVSKQLLEISCEYDKPVGLGIIGPNVSWSQVEHRTEAYAEKAVDAVEECLEAF